MNRYMKPNALAEQAKRAWGREDADAADRFIKQVSQKAAVQAKFSDTPETPPPDGQPAW